MIVRRWSAQTGQAAWLARRLVAAGTNVVTSVVPSGFAAYARLLHPVAAVERPGATPVRWRDIARWSGLPLEGESEFHAVALPPVPVATPPPWRGQGPRRGSLEEADLLVLLEILRSETSTPGHCWFCLWEGYDLAGVPLSSDGADRVVADPIPEVARRMPRVELPHRSYLLYSGPLEDALLVPPPPSPSQSANLFWPEDRAWCVASEIDLAWTYVGGSPALVRALADAVAPEALEVAPDAPVVGPVAPWVERWAADALESLVARGEAVVTTPVGHVRAALERTGPRGTALLRTWSRSALGHRAGGTRRFAPGDEEGLRRDLVTAVAAAIVALVGG